MVIVAIRRDGSSAFVVTFGLHPYMVQLLGNIKPLSPTDLILTCHGEVRGEISCMCSLYAMDHGSISGCSRCG